MRLELLQEGAGFQIARVGSLLVTTHAQAATVLMVDALQSVLAAQEATYKRFSVLAVVSGTGIRSPESGLKERVVAQERRFEKAIIGAAVCIEARGLPAIFTRSFLTAYTLLSSHQFELKSFGTLEAGVSWLQSLPGQDSVFSGDLTCAAAVRTLTGQGAATTSTTAR